jgi:hypothetical protein
MKLPAEFLNRYVVGPAVLLHDGRQAPLDFYSDVYGHCCEQIPTMRPGLTYRAEHFTGPNFWVPLLPVLARLAGRCVHDMAERDLLPLLVVPSRSATLRYRLR